MDPKARGGLRHAKVPPTRVAATARAGALARGNPREEVDAATALVAAARSRVTADPAIQVDEDDITTHSSRLQVLANVAQEPSSIDAGPSAVGFMVLPGLAREVTARLRKAGQVGHVFRDTPIATQNHDLPHRLLVYIPADQAEAALADVDHALARRHNVVFLDVASTVHFPPARTAEAVGSDRVLTVTTFPDDSHQEAVAKVNAALGAARQALADGGVVVVKARTPVEGATTRHAYLEGAKQETRQATQAMLDALVATKFIKTEEATLGGGDTLGAWLDARPKPKGLVAAEGESIHSRHLLQALPHLKFREVDGVAVDVAIADAIYAPLTARANLLMDARVLQVSPTFLDACHRPWAHREVSPPFYGRFLGAAKAYLGFLALHLTRADSGFRPVTQAVWVGGDRTAAGVHVGWMPTGGGTGHHMVGRWSVFRDLDGVVAEGASSPSARVYHREVEESQWGFVQPGLRLGDPKVVACPSGGGGSPAECALRLRLYGDVSQGQAAPPALVSDGVRTFPGEDHPDTPAAMAWFSGDLEVDWAEPEDEVGWAEGLAAAAAAHP